MAPRASSIIVPGVLVGRHPTSRRSACLVRAGARGRRRAGARVRVRVRVTVRARVRARGRVRRSPCLAVRSSASLGARRATSAWRDMGEMWARCGRDTGEIWATALG